ncbi:MAG: glycosyltransferase family 39 protein [Armatimonadota bacterium]
MSPKGTGERLIFESALGFGILGMLIFAMGMLEVLYPSWILWLLVVTAVISYRELAGVISDAFDGLKAVRKIKWNAEMAIIAAILASVAVLALVRSLAPPVGDDWDSLAYHLAISKLFLKHHGIYYIDFSSHSNFPFTWEMLYTLGLSFGSVSLAKLFHFGAGVILTGAVYSMSARHFSRSTGRLAALMVAGIPLLAWEATTAYIDLAVALYLLLTVYALLNFSEEGDKKWALVAGLTAGLAAGTKMTALLMIPIAFVWILWPNRAKSGVRSLRWKTAFTAVLLAAVIAAPWYVKSYVYTQNPVYPFAYGVFGGKNWSAETAKAYRDDQKKFGRVPDAQSPVMLPWNLTFRFARFNDYAARAEPGLELPAFTGSSQVYLSSVGPLLLAFLPLVLFGMLRKGKHRPLLIVSCVMIAAWYITMQNTRYLLPALAMLAPVMAHSAELIKVRKAAVAASVTAGAFTVMLMLMFVWPVVPVVFGMEAHDHYLDRSLNIYRASSFVNKSLPRDGGIALFGETRGFYIGRDYIWADPGHNALIPYDSMGSDPEKLLGWLRNRGMSYVLVNKANFPDYRDESAPASAKLIWQAVGNRRLKEVFNDPSDIAVYRIAGRSQ